jgi:hypothetical protein
MSEGFPSDAEDELPSALTAWRQAIGLPAA